MTYYGAKELAAAHRTVRKNTIKIAEEIPENQYDFRATPETRTVRQLLTHISVSSRFFEQAHIAERRTTLEGFDFFAFWGPLMAEEQTPRSKSQVIDMLRNDGDRFAALVEKLPETFLAEQVTMPAGVSPASRTRFEVLLSVKEHEMSHRAQLMVIERMIGIVPHLTRDMEAMIAARQSKAAN